MPVSLFMIPHETPRTAPQLISPFNRIFQVHEAQLNKAIKIYCIEICILASLYDCAAPAPLWIQDKIQTAGRNTKNGAENQSGAGSPQSKVRPERLTKIKSRLEPLSSIPGLWAWTGFCGSLWSPCRERECNRDNRRRLTFFCGKYCIKLFIHKH